MRYATIAFAVILLALSQLSCSPGTDEQSSQATAAPERPDGRRAAPPKSLAADIEGFLGYYWGDGTDIITDMSSYDFEAFEGSDIYTYNGNPFNIEDFGIEVDYDIYEFRDGGLVSGEVGGRNMDDMNKMHDYLVEAYGEPQEVTEGLYEWRSRTGSITLDDTDVYWRMTAWSVNATHQ